MKIIADLHTHTVASGHAYSTVMENARIAGDKGLELIALTDHGPGMPGAPHKYHFSNMKVLPNSILGVNILRGVEANIVDEEGNIDLSDRFLKNLDIVLAGFHWDCFEPRGIEENTRAMVRTITGGKVDVIVHPGNPAFKINPEPVVRAALAHNVLLEINNTSLAGLGRRGSKDNCLALAKAVAQGAGKVSLGSDAHYCSQVGSLDKAAKLAHDAGLTADQVINTSLSAIYDFLAQRGRRPKSIPVPVK